MLSIVMDVLGEKWYAVEIEIFLLVFFLFNKTRLSKVIQQDELCIYTKKALLHFIECFGLVLCWREVPLRQPNVYLINNWSRQFPLVIFHLLLSPQKIASFFFAIV